MARPSQLSREDVMFIAGENERIYQHVAGLIVLDTTDVPGFDYEHFRAHCIERASLIPHFRWKLHSVPMGLDRPYWVEDEHFSFDHHIKRIALPAPGDMDTLCELAASLYSQHLDRTKPLWEMWLIEGLSGNRFAYMQKFHHSMMDGEGALKMIEVICDFEAQPTTEKIIDPSISGARAGAMPTSQQQSSRAIQHLAQLPGEAARSAFDLLRPKILEQFIWPRPSKEKKPEVPVASFNREVSSERAITTASLPLEQIMLVKKQFEVSLNDVILALVSTTIRHYLEAHGGIPEDSLRTNIPVSLRTTGDDDLSNKVTTTTVTLATDRGDPALRLLAIHKEAEAAKKHAHDGTMGMVEMFQMMPPIMVSTLMGSVPAEQLPEILGANLIVSNVRGSPVPLYIAGAKLDKMYPVSILTEGIGINITCISYLHEMDFGITVDPDIVPDYAQLSDGLHAALKEYVALCKPPRQRKAPAKKNAAANSSKKAARKKTARRKKPAGKSAKT